MSRREHASPTPPQPVHRGRDGGRRRQVWVTVGLATLLPIRALGLLPAGVQEIGLAVVSDSSGVVVEALDFGETRIGSDSPWHVVTVANRGQAAFDSLSFSFRDAAGGTAEATHFVDYQAPGPGGTCATSLPGHSSCTLVLQASPVRVGPFEEGLRVSYVQNGRSRDQSILRMSGVGSGLVLYASSDSGISRAISQLGPGATLIVEDGAYGDVVMQGVSGDVNNPVILRSRSDGGAHVRSISISDASYLHVVGFEAGLSRDGIEGDVVRVSASGHVLLRRVTAHHAEEAGNHHVVAISESRYITLEDCAAWGSGRIQFLYFDSEFGIFRRVWGQHLHNESDTWPRTVLALYYGSHSLVENSIATQAKDADPGVGQIEGFKVNSRNGVRIPDDNTLRGNVAYGLQGPAYSTLGDHEFVGTWFENNVAIGPEDHYLDTAFDPSAQAIRTTVRQHTFVHTTMGIGSPLTASGGAAIDGILTQSIFRDIGRAGRIRGATWSLLEKVGDLPSRLGQGTREVADLQFDEAGYGRVGAYLIRPRSAKGWGPGAGDVGAEILFRYAEQDGPVPTSRAGDLTGIPLWPHPLEERVWRESAGTISITYERRDGESGLGGVWRDPDAVRAAYRRP